MPTHRRCRSRRNARRGMTIAEVALALIVFGMMAVLFGAVFPMTMRGAQHSNNYAQAAMLAQHKMDQLRTAGVGRFHQSDLAGLAIIDAAQPSGYPEAVTGGAAYSFTTADSLVNDGVTYGYFPSGSTGIVTITDYAASHPGSGTPAGKVAYITVAVKWTTGSGADSSYSTSAMMYH